MPCAIATIGLWLLVQASLCVGGSARETETPPVRGEMLVSTAWLADHLSDPDLVLLYVASNDAVYSRRHIPGARLLLLSSIVVNRGEVPNELPALERLRAVFEDAGVSNASHVVLYGERYGLLAARAYFTLDYMGLGDHTALLDGGWDKWQAERRPESKAVREARPGKLKLSPHPEVLVDLAQMKTTIERSSNSGTPAILDARPHEEFTGERLSEDVSTMGHIPGAVSLYWMNNLVSKENPVLRPSDELRKMYSSAANDRRELITYCRSGMQSSFDYFVGKYLGYKAGMYDGSFFEWSREKLPAEADPKAR